MDKWEESLVSDLKRGNKEAFERCYRQMSPQIYTAIYNICHNAETASELLQDTFLDVLQNIHLYKESGSFQGWVKRIAFNNTFNFVKRSHRILLLEEVDNEEECFQLNISQRLNDSRLITSLLDRCSEVERLILWMFIVEEYSHQEIADLTGKSASFSKSIVSRTLKRIRLLSEVKKHA